MKTSVTTGPPRTAIVTPTKVAEAPRRPSGLDRRVGSGSPARRGSDAIEGWPAQLSCLKEAPTCALRGNEVSYSALLLAWALPGLLLPLSGRNTGEARGTRADVGPDDGGHVDRDGLLTVWEEMPGTFAQLPQLVGRIGVHQGQFLERV